MSTFSPGSGGTIKSTNLPAAFFEVAREFDEAEQTRNGNNPGLTPRRNLATTVSFDTGTISVAATLPINIAIDSTGQPVVTAQDYLGSTYSAFNGGGGDLKSTNIIAAFLEMANLLAAAEKSVTPVENQPNNVQIAYDLETGTSTISANLPFNTVATANGAVTIVATDYL